MFSKISTIEEHSSELIIANLVGGSDRRASRPLLSLCRAKKKACQNRDSDRLSCLLRCVRAYLEDDAAGSFLADAAGSLVEDAAGFLSEPSFFSDEPSFFSDEPSFDAAAAAGFFAPHSLISFSVVWRTRVVP